MERIIDTDGAVGVVIRNWLGANVATNLYAELLAVDWIAGTISMYGKTFDVPRLQFFLGDKGIEKYTYSRRSYDVLEWDSDNLVYNKVKDIRDRIRNDPLLKGVVGQIEYDSCLINYYRNGNDSISPHSDKEALGLCNTVVTVSLGESRTFVIRSIRPIGPRKYYRQKVTLNNGDLLLMAGTFQEKYTHEIPKEDNKVGRMSLTFRLIGRHNH